MKLRPSAIYRARRLVLVGLAVLVSGPAVAADAPNGERIYKARCAVCHGPAGEGSKKYKQPLEGDRTPSQLAKLIAKTMPEDDPGTCIGADADAVSVYIHDTFYSATAREKNAPPRVELARLTVRQYRNSVADLIGRFRPATPKDDRRGLHGEFFDARGFRDDKRIIDRTDPEVTFDFGVESPAPGEIGAHQFAIRWEGSVLAPDTGTYEFVVRTDHAARFWVNNLNRPLIDALVRSGSDTEYRAPIYLIGGRAYPVRLEFFKAKQGVDDSKKEKSQPPVKAFVSLEWKAPNHTTEVIPARHLSPVKASESFIPAAPFPPDDRSRGWERGTTVSKAWDQSATDGALDAAAYVIAHLDELAGTKEAAPDRSAKVKAFCRTFAERAFRRPLSAEQAAAFIDRPFAAAPNVEIAAKRAVLFVLKSPRFLYREVGDGPSGYDVAGRLSFGLWDSLPDAELLAAAAGGRLVTREQVAQQAERMLADPRARAKLRDFLLMWLKVDRAADVAKDAKRFPGFDADIVSDLRTSLDLFLEEVVWSDGSDFRRLLLADELYLNSRLAQFYGADLLADAPFTKVRLNPETRAGVLTHPFLMAAFAYTGDTSPIHRGVFLTRGVLGRTLRPPPDAFTPLAADLHPTLTTRERVSLQTKPAACAACHTIINPLGFTLENFDAVGRYRATDHDKPVDATGTYLTASGKTVTFAGPRDLATFLASSEDVHSAFVEQLFHHLVQQPVRAYGPDRLAELRAAFAKKEYSIRKLAVEIVTAAALPPDPTRP